MCQTMWTFATMHAVMPWCDRFIFTLSYKCHHMFVLLVVSPHHVWCRILSCPASVTKIFTNHYNPYCITWVVIFNGEFSQNLLSKAVILEQTYYIERQLYLYIMTLYRSVKCLLLLWLMEERDFTPTSMWGLEDQKIQLNSSSSHLSWVNGSWIFCKTKPWLLNWQPRLGLTEDSRTADLG